MSLTKEKMGSVKLTFILTLDQRRLTIRSPSSSRLGGRDLPSQKQKGSISIWRDFRHWFSPLETLFFHNRLFDRISHGLGIDPSSFLMRSLGDVRHFSGLCFVWFGQSCCCSSVSQLRTKDCFPSAFRSYFAWFGHRSF